MSSTRASSTRSTARATGSAAVAGRRPPLRGEGVEFLLEAVARVAARAARAFHLDVVGDGPLRGEFEALATSLGVADRGDLPRAADQGRDRRVHARGRPLRAHEPVRQQPVRADRGAWRAGCPSWRRPSAGSRSSSTPALIAWPRRTTRTASRPRSRRARRARRVRSPGDRPAAKERFGREHVGRLLADAYSRRDAGPEGRPGSVIAMDGPRVAVVVPCFDDGETLSEALGSLRDEEPHELVVVDDGSTDPATLGAPRRASTRPAFASSTRRTAASRPRGWPASRRRPLPT